MKKLVITLDGEVGVLAESNFSKEDLEAAAAAISEDAEKHDVYLDEEQIIVELQRKGYFKPLEEKVEIIQFYI